MEEFQFSLTGHCSVLSCEEVAPRAGVQGRFQGMASPTRQGGVSSLSSRRRTMVSSFQRGSGWGENHVVLCHDVPTVCCFLPFTSYFPFHPNSLLSVQQSENAATTEAAAELPNAEQDSVGVSGGLSSAHLTGARFYLLIAFICSLLLIF